MRPLDSDGPSRSAAREEAGTRFIVLTTPRSGSTWFVDVLGGFPGTTAYTELFLPRRKPREERSMSWRTAEHLDRRLRGHPLFCETSPRLAGRPFSVVAYLNDVYRRPGAVGFKVMYSNLLRYPELWAYVVARRLRVVHLVRANLLDVVVSERVWRASRTVHRVAGEPEVAIEPIRIDPVELVEQIRRMQRRANVMRALLRACRVVHLEVRYEALVRDPDPFGAVCAFLSIEPSDPMPVSQLDKLVKQPPSEIIRNYDEVKRVLDAAGLASSYRDAFLAPSARVAMSQTRS
jgi:LPS sulfotransferase NodH